LFYSFMSNTKFLFETADKLQNPNPYRRIIGKLLYLTNTRPDITFVVQLLSQFVQEPIVHHQQVVQHVLHYIKANLVHGLFFNSESKVHIKVFSDSDWASSLDTRCSIMMWVDFRWFHFRGDTLLMIWILANIRWNLEKISTGHELKQVVK